MTAINLAALMHDRKDRRDALSLGVGFLAHVVVEAGLRYMGQDRLFQSQQSQEQFMYRKQYWLSRQLVAAMALALDASGVAVADDSSMRRFGSDSYAYFANQSVVSAPSAWRQAHPNGLTDRELQALSSSDLSAFVSQLNPTRLASAPADPTWRQSHSGGLMERELMAVSSSSLSRWQVPSRPITITGQDNVAQSLDKQTFAARMASFFHPK